LLLAESREKISEARQFFSYEVSKQSFKHKKRFFFLRQK